MLAGARRWCVIDLAVRWAMVRDTRVVPSDDPVTYTFVDGKLKSLES